MRTGVRGRMRERRVVRRVVVVVVGMLLKWDEVKCLDKEVENCVWMID